MRHSVTGKAYGSTCSPNCQLSTACQLTCSSVLQIKLLQQSIQNARQDAERAGEDSSHILDELKASKMILQGHGPGGDLRKLLKQKQPSLLAWLLGPRTNVISARVSQRMYKNDTHACLAPASDTLHLQPVIQCVQYAQHNVPCHIHNRAVSLASLLQGHQT